MNDLKKEHWVRCKTDNENLILNSKMNIEMANNVIALCDKKIAEFPPEPVTPKPKLTTPHTSE